MKKYFNFSRYKELPKQRKSGKISFLDIELLNFSNQLSLKESNSVRS
jgi:hypothetical protein